MTTATSRRDFVAGVIALLALRPRLVRADFFGADVVVLLQILAQAITQVNQLYTQIHQLETQIKLTHTILRGAEGHDLKSILQFLNRTAYTLQGLTRSVQSIGYRLQSIDREYKAVYRQRIRGAPPSSYNAMYSSWQMEILASAQVAERAQTNLATLEEKSVEAKRIVQSSASTEGVVGQLQLILQMLGLIEQDLVALQRTLDTGSRVATNVAATGASEKELIRERKRLNTENYTSRGTPQAVPSRLR